MLVTRIAPTPSGYLHVGNAVNFVLTSWLARGHRGRLLLRIDDFDPGRIRPAYLEDVFRTLEWLGIAIDDGPSGPEDFHASWSMSHRLDRFAAIRDRLMAGEHEAVFVCSCSRQQLGSGGRCVARCRERGLALTAGESALRMAIPQGAEHSLSMPGGDLVIWRRDDLPGYQLGSVITDEDLGVTAIVRGVDLLESSALQLHLARLLPAPGFSGVDLRHHELVTAANGRKLSKSAGSQATPMDHTNHVRRHVLDRAARVAKHIGIESPEVPRP